MDFWAWLQTGWTAPAVVGGALLGALLGLALRQIWEAARLRRNPTQLLRYSQPFVTAVAATLPAALAGSPQIIYIQQELGDLRAAIDRIETKLDGAADTAHRLHQPPTPPPEAGTG